MPRLPRYSSWDVYSRALNLDDLTLRARQIRLGRPPARWRIRVWSRSIALRPSAVIAIAAMFVYVFLLIWASSPLSSGYSQGARDTVKWLGAMTYLPILLFALIGRVDTTLVPIARERTAHVRRALRAQSQGTLTCRDLQALSHVIANRREHAQSHILRKAGARGGFYLAAASSGKMAILLASWMVPAIALPLLAPQSSFASLVVLVPFVGLFGLLAFVHVASRRHQSRLLNRCCVDCGYTLDHLPSMLSPLDGAAVDTGPARCPECGCPWPLIPPILP